MRRLETSNCFAIDDTQAHSAAHRTAARLLVCSAVALLGGCAEPSSSQSNTTGNGVVPLFQGESLSCSGSNGPMSCSLTLESQITPEKSAELKTEDDLRNHCSIIFDNYRQVKQSKTCSSGPQDPFGKPDINAITSVSCLFPVLAAGESDSPSQKRSTSITVAAADTSMSDEVSKLCSENDVTCTIESDPCKGDGLVLKISDKNDQLGGLAIAKICHAYSKPTKGNFAFEATLTSGSYPDGVTVCKGVFGSFKAGESAAPAPAPEPKPEPEAPKPDAPQAGPKSGGAVPAPQGP